MLEQLASLYEEQAFEEIHDLATILVAVNEISGERLTLAQIDRALGVLIQSSDTTRYPLIRSVESGPSRGVATRSSVLAKLHKAGMVGP